MGWLHHIIGVSWILRKLPNHFPKWLCSLYPTTSVRERWCLHVLDNTWCSHLLNGPFNRYVVASCCDFNLHFLMTNDSKYFLMCSMYYPHTFFSCISSRILCSLLWSFESSLYVLGTSPLSDEFCEDFLLVCGLSFHLLNNGF